MYNIYLFDTFYVLRPYIVIPKVNMMEVCPSNFATNKY